MGTGEERLVGLLHGTMPTLILGGDTRMRRDREETGKRLGRCWVIETKEGLDRD
jgi:hypothetical protein